MKPDKKCKYCIYYATEFDDLTFRLSLCNQCDEHDLFRNKSWFLDWCENVIIPAGCYLIFICMLCLIFLWLLKEGLI